MKTARKVLIAALIPLFALGFAAAVLVTQRADASESAEASIRADAVIAEGLRIRFTARLPEGYSAPVLETEHGGFSSSVRGYQENGDGTVTFSYGGANFDSADEDVSARLTAQGEGGRRTLGEITFNAADYFRALLDEAQGTDSESLYHVRQSYAAGALLMIETASGETLLSEEERALVPADDNRFNGQDASLRDVTSQGTGESGFAWKAPEADLAQGFRILYAFSAPASVSFDRAEITANGKTAVVFPVKTGETDAVGTPVYAFGAPVTLSDFSYEMQVAVFSGDRRVSPVLVYSFNRALARATQSGDAKVREEASCLYRLGKAAARFLFFDRISYDVLPNITDNGVRVGHYLDYVYDDFPAEQSAGKFGEALYFDGIGYVASECLDPLTGEGTQILWENGYAVSLDGADADGIVSMNGGLDLSVRGECTVSGNYMRSWDDKNARIGAAVAARGDLTITGGEGAKLTVRGSLLASGALTVENVDLVVVTDRGDRNGITAESVTVRGGSLTVLYESAARSFGSGMRITEDLSLDQTKLTVGGFGSGIRFGGNAEHRSAAFILTESEAEISAEEYGIDAVYSAGYWSDWEQKWVDEVRYTVALDLADGCKMDIRAAQGTLYTDVTLADAELSVTARTGGLGSDGAPMNLTTTGKSPEKGRLSVVVTGSGYAIAASSVDLDGGTVVLQSANNGSSAAKMFDHAAWSLKNCTVRVVADESTPSVHGIDANCADATLSVDVTASLFFEHCDAPFVSWTNGFTVRGGGLIFARGASGHHNDWDMNTHVAEGTVIVYA